MTLLATLFPLICWFAYNAGVRIVEQRYPSLSTIMSLQRRRWVANAARKETPFDAILAGNLMGSISFLASTSALLVLASFAGFGQMTNIMAALSHLGLDRNYVEFDIQVHFATLLVMMVLSFFAFTLSLRQFNHFCILLGALGRQGEAGEAEIDAAAGLNTIAARSFDNGIRGYYFAVPMVAWFVVPWLAIALSLAMTGFIAYREFFSSAHRLEASFALSANRREAAAGPAHRAPAELTEDDQLN